jgi:hypothetical protein
MGNYVSSFANGAAVDAELTKVANSNLSATHKITRSATLVIAASDSSAKSKAQADYVCDGIDDQDEINAAITAISTTGGVIQLLEGNFSVSGEITGSRAVMIRGMGAEATIITQTAQATVIINLGASQCSGVSDLKIVMPTTNSGHGIRFSSDGVTISNVKVQGGSVESYFIYIYDAFAFDISHVGHDGTGMTCNGICLENVSGLFNYGNAKISNVSFTQAANTYGIRIIGNGTKNFNLIHFSAINIVSGEASGNYGIHISGCGDMQFDMLDLEQLATAIYLTNATKNLFSKVFTYNCTADITLATGAFNNTFINGNAKKITETDDAAALYRRNEFIGYPLITDNMRIINFVDEFAGAAVGTQWHTVGTVEPHTTLGSVISMKTGATTNDTARIDFGGVKSFSDLYGTIFSTKLRRYGVSGYTVRFGLVDGGFDDTNIGAWWEQPSGGTTWMCVCCNGSAKTTYDTGITRSTVMHTFSIVRVSNGIEFYYDGALQTRITTNLPTVTVLREPVIEILTVENVEHTMFVDRISVIAGVINT